MSSVYTKSNAFKKSYNNYMKTGEIILPDSKLIKKPRTIPNGWTEEQYDKVKDNYKKTEEIVLPDPKSIKRTKIIPNGWTKDQYEKEQNKYNETGELILPKLKKPKLNLPNGWDSKTYLDRKAEYIETGELILPTMPKLKYIDKWRGACGTYVCGQKEIPEKVFRINGHDVPRICQQDDAWANERYANSNIGLGGCGPSAMSSCLAAQGDYVSPSELAKMECHVPGRGKTYADVKGAGTDSTLMIGWFEQRGFKAVSTYDKNFALSEMDKKGAVCVGKKDLSHYISILSHDAKTGTCEISDSDICEILRNPEGIYSEEYVSQHVGEWIILYPKE